MKRLAKSLPPARILIWLIWFVLISTGCRTKPGEIVDLAREPVIYPDYSGITIPFNIAPMNFVLSEEGDYFKIIVTSSAGTKMEFNSHDKLVKFPAKSWRKLVEGSKGGRIMIGISTSQKNGKTGRFLPINMNVAGDPVDPYICYRILYPGYESWGKMKIIQRSLEDFRESSVIENQVLDGNCVNCHAFSQYDAGNFMIHIRGSMAGTYFVINDTLKRTELRTGTMPGNAVYPSWHPSGKYIAFSSNRIYSVIHMKPGKNIELYDRSSMLILYDPGKNIISPCTEKDSIPFMETYPAWSPDGKYLYYCRTGQVRPGFDYQKVRYDIYRMAFNEETTRFGSPEKIFDADLINKSASFPVISPDGNYLIFVLHNYGSFPGWHKEADLYAIDLRNMDLEKLNVNSDESESYASWSSNSKWLVFSSKRDDGLHSRLYLAYSDGNGKTGKPFVMPLKDPSLYNRLDKSFNRPHFILGRIKAGPRDFATASKKEAIKAIWSEKR